MNKVGVVTDSTCCLPREVVEQNEIRIVPIYIIYQGHSYHDGVDITPGEVYKIMRRKKEFPTTSTPSIGDFLEAYSQMSRQKDKIICITLTGVQSKTYEAALLARDKARETLPGINIEVLDSGAVAGALGFIVLEAARKAVQGADLTTVIEAARNMMGRVNHISMVDSLFYLARTGRVGRAAAWAGTILNMKPVLEHSTATGITMPLARPRTRARAVDYMLKTMAERVGKSPVHVMVHHADEPVDGAKLKAAISSRFSCVELYLTEFTPGMGIHAGPGILGVSFYTD